MKRMRMRNPHVYDLEAGILQKIWLTALWAYSLYNMGMLYGEEGERAFV